MVRRPFFAEYISKYCCITLNTPSNFEKVLKASCTNLNGKFLYEYIPSKNRLKIVDEPDHAAAIFLCLYHNNLKK